MRKSNTRRKGSKGKGKGKGKGSFATMRVCERIVENGIVKKNKCFTSKIKNPLKFLGW